MGKSAGPCALDGELVSERQLVASTGDPGTPADQAPPPAVPAAPPAAPQVPAAAPAERLPTREIARRASGYTVFVRSGGAYGAGVVFDHKGRILTCNHVLLADDAEVYFEGRQAPIRATVHARDPKLDLALLVLEEAMPPGVTPAASLGVERITTVERGDEVYAMGAPRKMRFSFQRGVVSFAGRPFDDVYYIQTDVPMNPGSSGGPVLNDRGDLIGIATFVMRGSEGLAFALPIDYALRRFAVLDGEGRRSERLAEFSAWLQTREAGSVSADSMPAAVAAP